jgi:hypothetical protein
MGCPYSVIVYVIFAIPSPSDFWDGWIGNARHLLLDGRINNQKIVDSV